MVAPALLAGGLEVVNFAMGAIGVIGFGMDQVKEDVNNVNVRIRTGLDNTPDPEKKGSKLDFAGGHKPYIQAFNVNGDAIGSGGGENTGHCGE